MLDRNLPISHSLYLNTINVYVSIYCLQEATAVKLLQSPIVEMFHKIYITMDADDVAINSITYFPISGGNSQITTIYTFNYNHIYLNINASKSLGNAFP